MLYHIKSTGPIEHAYDKKYDVINDYTAHNIICHCWWSGIFSEKQLFSIKSFIATQKSYSYRIIIWHDRNFILDKKIEQEFFDIAKKYNIKIQSFNPESEICDYQKNEIWIEHNVNLTYISDNIRIILLYKYGGLWFDLDCCFLRDMNCCYINEFAYEWEFQDYGNNALLFFRKNSTVLHKIILNAIKHRSFEPQHILSYTNSYISELKIYPCYMFDPAWMGCVDGMPYKNDFYKFFTSSCNIASFEEFSPNSYVYHWHNNWNTPISDNSFFRCFEKQFNKIYKHNRD